MSESLAVTSSADGLRFVEKPEWQGTEYGQVADTGAVTTGKLVGYTRVLMSNFVIATKWDIELKSNFVIMTKWDIELKSNFVIVTKWDIELKSNFIIVTKWDIGLKSSFVRVTTWDTGLKSNFVIVTKWDIGLKSNFVCIDAVGYRLLGRVSNDETPALTACTKGKQCNFEHTLPIRSLHIPI